jgi:hypothetical protein
LSSRISAASARGIDVTCTHKSEACSSRPDVSLAPNSGAEADIAGCPRSALADIAPPSLAPQPREIADGAQFE